MIYNGKIRYYYLYIATGIIIYVNQTKLDVADQINKRQCASEIAKADCDMMMHFAHITVTLTVQLHSYNEQLHLSQLQDN
jgi:hypothetical protein